jgi:hypothetical protein
VRKYRRKEDMIQEKEGGNAGKRTWSEKQLELKV